MAYIKNGKRYSASSISSISDKADQYGFHELHTQPYPAYDKQTQGIVDSGNIERDGKWFIDWQVVDLPAEAIQKNLELAKQDAVKKLFDNCDKDLVQLSSSYPGRESDTWPVQLQEAKEYLADNTVATPFISAALEDGETVADYANLIVANNTAWSDYAGKVVLKRRAYQKRIEAAATFDELRQIHCELNA